MSQHTKTTGFPISHVMGFLMSLVLTFGAVFVALKTSLPLKTIIWVIGTLAVIQAAMQLYMFMHMNEGEDGKAQLINIVYAFFIAAVTVFGTVWVMSFGM
ncbi:cytochrome aa3 quinol oxidase subunit IV [Bacillus sp. 1NLA3E]|jgi:cytochrome aa3-600 menaquinol oxidase subunit 4|uniref:cytochrome aa3 quinol oxidase subunit IV n=1 Tax=Bacillus sp. 1NLA3E TaxID=666686 RepID=UPI000247EABD|nr:cytochrome aa3 quinol oxidase subunit IV [Bacillus sp. 1NLA3E]AGK53388.1 cytochrome aa3 quinol oxidase subunit IV [Bacillus sp. 1NLA3E]